LDSDDFKGEPWTKTLALRGKTKTHFI